jgi:hypothetical protein
MVHLHLMAAHVPVIGILLLLPVLLIALAALIRLRRKPLPRGIVIAALLGTAALTGAFAWTANLGGQIGHSEITTSGAPLNRAASFARRIP